MKKTFLTVAIVLALCFTPFSTWAAPGDLPDHPIIISTVLELDAVRLGLNKFYKLSNDIDLNDYLALGGEGYAKWNTAGWEPIGTALRPFTGGFDGNRHKIMGLWIDRNTDHIGLFGYIEKATIANLSVEITDKGVKGSWHIGGLIGASRNSSIENCNAAGNVNGHGVIGGLAGYATNCSITNSYASGNVKGDRAVGGLVGSFSGSIINSYATGDVEGSSDRAGGLVGWLEGSGTNSNNIVNSYATGNVNGSWYVGGLVGWQNSYKDSSSKIENSYATGNVNGNVAVSGLVGRQSSFSGINVIINSYATGSVNGDSGVGGLVGDQEDLDGTSTNIITNSYATGNVSGDSGAGGLVGGQIIYANGTNSITNSYATGNVSGNSSVSGLVGRQNKGVDVNGINSVTNSYRYQFATVNGVVRSENMPDGIHGGIKTMNELLTKTTYTNNGWLFNDSTPTAGPWYWDGIGFPKFNIGTFTPIIIITTQPQEITIVTVGSIPGNLSVSVSLTPSEILSYYQWYSNTKASNTDGTSIYGATNAIFTIPTDLTAGNYYYYCVVSVAGAAPVSSNVARVVIAEEEDGGGGGNCKITGYNYFIFALFGIMPLVFRKRQ